MDKEKVTRALEILGVEAVERGLGAFAETVPHGFSNCFLTYVLWGKPGRDVSAICQLQQKYGREFFLEENNDTNLGGVGSHLYTAFDHEREDFKRLVEEWLEINREDHESQARSSEESESRVPVLQAS